MSVSEQDISRALACWPQAAAGRATLINHSENKTYRIDIGGHPTFVLRVHRPGYQSLDSIESELAWLAALRLDTSISVPHAVAGSNGHTLQTLTIGEGQQHTTALFHFVDGVGPTLADLSALFGTLADYAARLHNHATHWHPPATFTRPTWQASSILSHDGLWGDWREAPGVDISCRQLLDRLDAALRDALARYGAGPDRFGLIHADMRLGNLLVAGDRVTLVDFDDCGFCWFMYDFAAAISFHETRGDIPTLKSCWLEHYSLVRKLAPQDVAIIDTMIMLRRMALLAWIGSHAATDLAAIHAPGFALGTADLAERYLGGRLYPTA